MRELLSPNQVAKAIGVSESSLKRWADQGRIPTVRTAGGHRRLPVNSVLEFVRDQGLELIDPTILGLPAATGSGQRTLERGRDHLLDAFAKGSYESALQIIVDLYLVPYGVAEIFDTVMRPALAEIGCRQAEGEMEIYEERRSVEFCSRILHEVSRMLPSINTTAPKAVGGTLDGDPYTTASKMAELVLRSNGYRAILLGNELPFDTIMRAVEAENPGLLWVSVSSIRNEDVFTRRVNELYDACVSKQTQLIVGGVALNEDVRRPLHYHGYCSTMSDLATFSRAHLEPLRRRGTIGDAL